MKMDKSPEQLQAQVVAFAAERIDTPDEKRYLYDILGSLASVASHDGWGDEIVTQYRDFLRRGSQYEPIRARTALIKRYNETFQPMVLDLYEDLQNYASTEEHPAFIGCGSESEVFSLYYEDTEYAVRLPYEEATEVIEKHVAGSLLGRGVPHLEQVEAVSYEDGVTVAKRVPGKVMTHRTAEDMRAVSDEHIATLIDTFITADTLGIELDPNFCNVLLDEKSGFYIVDFEAANPLNSEPVMGRGVKIGYAVAALMGRGVYERANRQKLVPITHANETEWEMANYDLYRRMRDTVCMKLRGQDRSDALAILDERLSRYKRELMSVLQSRSYAGNHS